MDMEHGQVYTLLETLAFPLAEWIWTLEPDFTCDVAKGGKSAKLRFFYRVYILLVLVNIIWDREIRNPWNFYPRTFTGQGQVFEGYFRIDEKFMCFFFLNFVYCICAKISKCPFFCCHIIYSENRSTLNL